MNFEEYNGYTIALYNDGYVHHAIISGVEFYPYEYRNGALVNACGMYKASEIQEKIDNQTVIWG